MIEKSAGSITSFLNSDVVKDTILPEVFKGINEKDFSEPAKLLSSGKLGPTGYFFSSTVQQISKMHEMSEKTKQLVVSKLSSAVEKALETEKQYSQVIIETIKNDQKLFEKVADNLSKLLAPLTDQLSKLETKSTAIEKRSDEWSKERRETRKEIREATSEDEKQDIREELKDLRKRHTKRYEAGVEDIKSTKTLLEKAIEASQANHDKFLDALKERTKSAYDFLKFSKEMSAKVIETLADVSKDIIRHSSSSLEYAFKSLTDVAKIAVEQKFAPSSEQGNTQSNQSNSNQTPSLEGKQSTNPHSFHKPPKSEKEKVQTDTSSQQQDSEPEVTLQP